MSAELYNLLVMAYTCVDNQIRSEAELSLTQQTIDNIQNFQYITQIAITNDKMQSQAISLLNSIILKMLSTNVQISNQHASSIFEVILSPQTQLKQKQLLQKSMTIMIKLQKVVKEEIENKIKQLLQSDKFNQIQCGILFFKSLLDSSDLQYSLSIDSKFDWMKEFFNLLTPLFKNLNDQNYQIEDEYLLTLRYYFQVMQEFCEKVFKPKNFNKDALIPIQNIILQSQSFQNQLFLMFQYSPSINQIKNCIIIHTQNELYDTKLNEIKMYCFKCIQLIFNLLLNARNKVEQKKTVFYTLSQNITQLILYTIFSYINSKSLKDILNKTFIPNILCSLLRLLSYLGGQTENYSYFQDAKIPLITEIIFPLLITTQQEYQQMQEMPEEFVNISLDIVDKQESEIPKTAAAQLLETLCDHIDGSTTFVAQLSIIVIQSSVLELNNQQSQQLKDFQKLSTEYSPIDRIDSSLLILTIISYLVQKRSDIIQIIEQLLQNNLDFFLNNKYQIIKARFALFFGYYCDNLFKSDVNTQIMIQYIQLLINQIQLNEPVVLYQTIDALKDIFEDDDLKSKTSSLVTTVFPQLIVSLGFSTYEQHFEMVANILKAFSQIFLQQESLLISLLKIIVQRIKYEENLVKKQQSRCIHLNRCWNLIRQLSTIDEFIPLYNKIEEELTPIYELMVISEECLTFEEDLILFTSSIIEKTQTISLLQQQILPYFQKLIKKQQGRYGHLYETLNMYIYYGKNKIFCNEQMQRTYFDLCLQPLINEISFEDVDLGESALLIQLGIEILRNDINFKILETIFQQTISLINNNSMTGIVRSRVTSIFLTSFYFIPQLTYQILGDAFQTIFQKVLITQYHPGYDIKLFILTMCQLVQQEPDYLVVVQVMVRNLKLQDTEEKMHQNDEDEMDDEDDDFMEEEDRMTAKQQIDQFKGSIVSIDEFQHFRNFIFILKQQKPQVIEQMKANFDQTTLKQLNELLNFIRIGNARQLITIKKRKQN